MPRLLVRADDHDRSRSLGWLATAWMEHFVLHGPGDVQGEPVRLIDEHVGFVVDCYAQNAQGRRLYDSAFISRPKGSDKSGMAAKFCLFEALGPARTLKRDGVPVFAQGGEVYEDPWGLGFRYEYAPGEPMGAPVKHPVVRCLATEENQTGLVYDTVLFNLQDGPLAGAMRGSKDAGITRILVPGGGEIIPSTASSASKDGGRETFVPADEVHLYVTPELRRMFSTVSRNLPKRGAIAEPWGLQTTTWFSDQEDSVAKATFKLAQTLMQSKGKKRGNLRQRLLFDHQWGEIDEADFADEKKLRAALVEAYGGVAKENGGWIDLEPIIDHIYDPRNAVAESTRYYLNAASSAESAFLQGYSWRAVADPGAVLKPGDTVALGFDGSRGRSGSAAGRVSARKVKPDATALVACRLPDMTLFELGLWEAGTVREAWDSWEPPDAVVEATIRGVFAEQNVVGFYGDPAAGWQGMLVRLEAEYAPRMKKGASASSAHPFHWWMTGGRSSVNEQILLNFEQAVLTGGLSHDGSPGLSAHVLHAYRGLEHGRLKLVKRTKDAEDKIDAAVAAVLAYAAASDALAKGAQRSTRSVTVPASNKRRMVMSG